MTTRTITAQTARRLAVAAQRLSGTPGAMLDVIRQLACLQLDPTSAVARSHQLVLWSRLGRYDMAEFERLMWGERHLFEYWAHAASIVLTENYPIHASQMRLRHADGESAWAQRLRRWLDENDGLRRHILDRLTERGPLTLSEMEASDKIELAWYSSGWTSNRTVARMVDHLWLAGQVMVHGRKGQARLWDLAERVLPDWTPRDEWSPLELTRRAVTIGLQALGVATATHIRNHFVRGHYPALADALSAMERDGSIQRVQVADDGKSWPGVWYIHSVQTPLLDAIERGEWQPRTTLLSPFDNLICDRKRTKRLFDFEFRLEIYTPKDKRQYGYFVMPILQGDRLIGRIDPLLDRKANRLIVHALHFEPTVKVNRALHREVQTQIEALAGWLGAREVALPST